MKFKSFDEEEQWLMEQAQKGWRLVSYDSEEFDDCIYKFVQDEAAKEYRYKIDFREFDSKTDFEDYKELFNETGWTLLSKNRSYIKHIFISTSGEEIFSDQASIIEREVRRYRSAKVNAIGSFVTVIVAAGFLYYSDFEYKALSVVVVMFLFTTWMYTINAMKSKKIINKAGIEE